MKKFISEFKEFALKGNMLDLAVGLIIGSTFNTVVKSIVDDIFMPVIGIIIGGRDFTKLSINIGSASITYGTFIQNMINFITTAFCLFLIIKGINSFKRKFKKEDEKQEEPVETKKPDDILLLEEIRDLLKNK